MGKTQPHHPETHTIPPNVGASAEQRFHSHTGGDHLGIAQATTRKRAVNVGEALGRRKRHLNHTRRTVLQHRQPTMRFNSGGNGFFIRALRRQRPHPAVTEFRLCKEFGWTPTQLAKQPARTVHEFTVILNEVDRQAEEERVKAEREAKRHVR